MKTKIEWTDHSWPIVNGCRRISPGCGGASGQGGCYAERLAATRLSKTPKYQGLAVFGEHGPRWTGQSRLWQPDLDMPLRLREPSKIFVADMGDLFFEEVSDTDIARVYGVMAASPMHTFQVLTKRAERLPQWYAWISDQASGLSDLIGETCPDGSSSEGSACVMLAGGEVIPERPFMDACNRSPWPLPNVWLGVSVENHAYAERRIPHLLSVPAAIRFLSVEPQLGPSDFGIDPDAKTNRFGLLTCPKCRGWGGSLTSLVPDVNGNEQMKACGWCRASGCGIDWVIVGGESGPRARPFEVEWARSIVAQCRTAGIAVFVKQLGAVPIVREPRPGEHPDAPFLEWPDGTGFVNRTGRAEFNGRQVVLRDRKGGDMSEWPEDLRVREFPSTETSRPDGRERAPAPDPAATEGAFDLEGS